MTEFNEKGMEVKKDDVEAVSFLIKKQINEMSECDLLVLTGSVPPGVPKDFYREIIGYAPFCWIKE